MEPQTQNNFLTIPMAIIVAGLLIAGAVFFSRGGAGEKGITREPLKVPDTAAAAATGALALRAIGASDHIRGNPSAEILIVEYSDTECPFCKNFHETMRQVINEYGKSGKVAWVYRHFPLDQLHSKTRKEAEATECAAELGGNTKFWEFIDELLRITPSNNGLNLSELPAIAERKGLDRSAFESCLASNKYAGRVENDYQEAIATGGTGTPWSILVTKDGQKIPINGAQPLSAVKEIIDGLLK